MTQTKLNGVQATILAAFPWARIDFNRNKGVVWVNADLDSSVRITVTPNEQCLLVEGIKKPDIRECLMIYPTEVDIVGAISVVSDVLLASEWGKKQCFSLWECTTDNFANSHINLGEKFWLYGRRIWFPDQNERDWYDVDTVGDDFVANLLRNCNNLEEASPIQMREICWNAGEICWNVGRQ
jgi:hypothetical protein